MSNHSMQDSDVTKCIKACLRTSHLCLEAFHYCLEEKGTAFSGKHLAILQFCADACQLSAKLLIGESSFHHQACELSYELCQACATECERYEYDEVFKHCAESCRYTAELCRGMSGMTVRVSTAEIQKAKSPLGLT